MIDFQSKQPNYDRSRQIRRTVVLFKRGIWTKRISFFKNNKKKLSFIGKKKFYPELFLIKTIISSINYASFTTIKQQEFYCTFLYRIIILYRLHFKMIFANNLRTHTWEPSNIEIILQIFDSFLLHLFLSFSLIFFQLVSYLKIDNVDKISNDYY